MSAEQAPRFELMTYAQRERGQRGDRRGLAQPLPPTSAAMLPAKARAEHKALVGRVEAARAGVNAAAQDVEQAAAADREERIQAVGVGRDPGPPTLPAAEQALEQAREHADAAEEALDRSANQLLELAYAKAPEAIEKVEQEIDEQRTRQKDLVSEALAAGAAAAQLDAERNWLGSLEAGRTAVRPFQGGVQVASELDKQLRRAVAEAASAEAKRREQIERIRREQAHFDAEQERARADADAVRARTARVVSSGGRVERVDEPASN